MFERILVAVDGSALSTHALEHAVRLVGSLGSKLEVLYVIPDPPFPTIPPLAAPFTIPDLEAQFEALEREATKILAHARERAEALGMHQGLVTLSRRAKGERIADVILKTASESGVELIVMGTHGHSGWDRFLLGSVASRVAHRAKIPVLLVPQQTRVT